MKFTSTLLLFFMTTLGWSQSDTNFFEFKEGIYLDLFQYNAEQPIFVEDLSSLNFLQSNQIDLEAMIQAQQATLNLILSKIDSLQSPLNRIIALEKQVAELQAMVNIINQSQNLNAVVSSEELIYTPTTTFDVPDDVLIHFKKQEFSINSESLMILNEVIDILTRNPKWKIVIKGFANDDANSNNNLTLARERSLEVQRMLISAGVNPAQLTLHFPNIEKQNDAQKVVIDFVQQ
jgi:outer membrane protein OmpA-like peptidoglycan-associated protein